MGATGLGAFTEGLQGGMAARDKHDTTKQYKRILSDKADRTDWQWDADVATAKGKWETDPTNAGVPYTAPIRNKIKDPALLRMMKKFGGRIKGMFGGDASPEASFASPEIAPSSPVAQQAAPQPGGFQQGQGIPAQGPMEQAYADGGEVERRYSPQGQEWMAGMDQSEKPEVTPSPDRDWEWENTRQAGHANVGEIDASQKAYREAETPREQGDAARGVVADYGRGTGEVAMGIGKDILDNTGISAGLERVGGFLGFDDEDASGVPVQGGEYPAPDNFDPDMRLGIDNAVDAPDLSDGEMAEESMSAGEQYAMENMDYQMLIDDGVRPDDLPTMNTRDWADYRQGLWEREISRGVSAKEALESVEYATVELQMRGAMREMDKANLYLESGQTQAAAMALRQTFQYFPNGSSMKFGTMKDPKTGLPAIIVMGVDEETGEAKGSPMVITQDRLAAMRAQMSDPKSFSAWTKDGHDLQVKVAQLEQREQGLDISQQNADTARMNAQSRRDGAGAGGGMSDAEFRQRSSYYANELGSDYDLMGEEAAQDDLVRAMVVYEALTGIKQPGYIKSEVMRAYRANPEGGVEALLDSVKQESGIPGE